MGALGLLVFIALWKSAESFEWVRRGTIPDPFTIPTAFWDELTSGRLVPAIGSSLVHYVWGLAFGSVLGFGVGLGVATQPWLDAFHAWLARILRPIPPLAWVVFAIAWFKVSHAGAAFVISIGVFWVNYFATYSAVRNVDPRFYELAQAFGRDTAVHAVVSRGGLAERLALEAARLEGFRAGADLTGSGMDSQDSSAGKDD